MKIMKIHGQITAFPAILRWQDHNSCKILSRVIRSAALVTWLTADQWRGLNGAGPSNCPAQTPVNAFTVVSH